MNECTAGEDAGQAGLVGCAGRHVMKCCVDAGSLPSALNDFTTGLVQKHCLIARSARRGPKLFCSRLTALIQVIFILLVDTSAACLTFVQRLALLFFRFRICFIA